MYGKEFTIYDDRKSSLFYVNAFAGKVWGIEIVDSRFSTARGIGINSTLGQMRIYYQGIKISETDSGVPYARLETINGRFFLQPEVIDLAGRQFPNQTKITSILIGNSPYLKEESI